MEAFRFEKLNAYQYARKLVKDVYEVLKSFPDEEKFGLTSQIRRAVVSVPSNIADGCGRMSNNEQRHFFEISYGSLMEVYCQLTLAVDLGYITESQITEVRELMTVCAKVISGLRNSVN